MTQFWNAVKEYTKKYTYVKISETERDIEFDEEEESCFDEDVIDLEF